MPPYNVILLDDNDHTYDYVIEMLGKVFGHPSERGMKMAKEVDSTGRVIVAATPLEHRLRYADQNNATSRAKPDGVAGMQLVRTVSDAPPSGPATAQLVGVVTRQPYIVQFEPEDARKTAYYWGRWQTASGKVGPWSQVASLTVAA